MGHVVSTKGIPSIDQQRLLRGGHSGSDDSDSIVEGNTGEECPICTEIVEIKHLARLNPCNHEFHQDCINQWLDDHSTCPNCRQEVFQVLFNFKGNYKDIQPILDDSEIGHFGHHSDGHFGHHSDGHFGHHSDGHFGHHSDILDEEDDLDEEEDEDIDAVTSLAELERMSQDHQYLGEEVPFADWFNFGTTGSSGNDFLSNMSSQVKIKISDEDWIFISFYPRAPQVFLQCTDTFLHWQVLHDDQIVAFVPSNTQLTIRGYYFLHLEELVIQVNGNKYPLKDDPDFEEFFHPSPDTMTFFEITQMESLRAERIAFFMDNLRAHFEEE